MAPYELWSGAFCENVRPLVVSAGVHKATPGWQSPPRQVVMDDFDIWYVAAGSGEVGVEGVWHPIAAGDLITMGPGVTCTGERASSDDPYQVYFVHLLPFGEPPGPLDQTLAAAWPLRLTMAHRPEILTVFDTLLEVVAVGGAHPSLRTRGLALQLLGIIFEELQGRRMRSVSPAHRRVLMARGFMEAHYAEPISVRDIADHVGLSASHLSVLFHDLFGLAPNQYLVRTRLREAKALLVRGESVKRAARAVGFQSPQYFARSFRQHEGLSPTEFAATYARDGVRPT